MKVLYSLLPAGCGANWRVHVHLLTRKYSNGLLFRATESLMKLLFNYFMRQIIGRPLGRTIGRVCPIELQLSPSMCQLIFLIKNVLKKPKMTSSKCCPDPKIFSLYSLKKKSSLPTPVSFEPDLRVVLSLRDALTPFSLILIPEVCILICWSFFHLLIEVVSEIAAFLAGSV